MYNSYLATTFEDAHQYYWNEINRSLNAMTQKEETKRKYLNHFKEVLQKEADRLDVSINSKQITAELCFKATQSILLETVLTYGKAPHVAYALEYFYYAPTFFDLGENLRAVNISSGAYYNQLVSRLKATLTKQCNATILNNIGTSETTILDLGRLRQDLRRTVEDFYRQNPELEESSNHIPELQQKVNKIFSNLSLEFDKKTLNNKSQFRF